MLNKSEKWRTDLNEIYAVADSNDITVVSAVCPESKALSLMSPSGNCYIGVDYHAIKNEREERQCLAHDVGHCVRGAFYNPYSPFSLIEQQEAKADRQAVEYLIPKNKFIHALEQGYTEIWQLCELFDVDRKYVKKAFWEYCDTIVE